MSNRILWVIIALLMLTIGIILLALSGTRQKAETEYVTVQDQNQNLKTVLAKGTTCQSDNEITLNLSPAKTFTISFPVNGTLEKGDVNLKVGQRFKFNDLLLKLDIRPAYDKLNDLKSALKERLNDALISFENELPQVLNKWTTFNNSVSFTTRLVDLPMSESEAETKILIRTGVVKAYMKAKEQEEEIEKYFFLAPSSGEISKVYITPGKKIRSGQVIAEYQTSKSSTLFGSIDHAVKDLPSDVEVLDNAGNKIGDASFIKRKKKDAGPDMVYYHFKGPIKQSQGYKIIATQEIECISIPIKAVNGNKVLLLKDDMQIEREIEIIKSNGETIFVQGLKEGDEIVLPD